MSKLHSIQFEEYGPPIVRYITLSDEILDQLKLHCAN